MIIATESFPANVSLSLSVVLLMTRSSYIGIPSNSWVDDYLDWLNPGSKCCRLYSTLGQNLGKYCPPHESEKHRIDTQTHFEFQTEPFLH